MITLPKTISYFSMYFINPFKFYKNIALIRCVKKLYLSFSDPCFQPVGVTNGLVRNIRNIGSSRLKGNCTEVRVVAGRLDTSMTIKGIAIRSTLRANVLKGLPIDYAYIDANPWIWLRESSRTKNAEHRVIILLR